MDRLTLTVPLSLNDGAPVTETELTAVERELCDIAGGFTFADGIGGWLSPDGVLYREAVRVYTLDVSGSDEERLAASYRLVSYAEFLAGALDQEGVYVTRTPGVKATIVTRAEVLQ